MNNKKLTILGLLAESPKHGYQLETDIEARVCGNGRRSASHPSITYSRLVVLYSLNAANVACLRLVLPFHQNALSLLSRLDVS